MSIFEHTQFDHNLLANVVRDYAALPEVRESPFLIDDIQWKIDNWRTGIYKLVVVGEIKKGKSSFVNALLGDPSLAPVAARVASSVPIKIVYGEKRRFRVHFITDRIETDGKRTEPKEISPEELEQYATETGTGEFSITREDGNNQNKLGVDYISIEYPNPLLKEGLTIVDLPGLGGIYQHHTRLVQEYLHPKRADHIIFVLDSTGSPLSKEEADSIRRLKEKLMDRFLFVQTKIDAPSSEQVERYKQENLRQISEILDVAPEKIGYFTVSSDLKLKSIQMGVKALLDKSNFLSLESYLTEQLIPERKDILAAAFAEDLMGRVNDIHGSLKQQHQIFSAESRQTLQDFRAEVTRHNAEYSDWKLNKFKKIASVLRDALVTAKNDSFRELRGRLHPHDIIEPRLAKIDGQRLNHQEIKREADQAFNDIKDAALSIAREVTDRYEDVCISALVKASEDLAESIPLSNLVGRNSVGDDVTALEIDVPTRRLEKIQGIMRGMAVGSSVGGWVVAGTTMMFSVPVVALTVVVGGAITLVAGLIGGKKALEEYNQLVAEKALAKLAQNIRSAFGKLQSEIFTEAEKIYEDVNKKIEKRFADSVAAKEKSLLDKSEAVAKAEKQSLSERKAAGDALLERIKRVSSLHQRLLQAFGE